MPSDIILNITMPVFNRITSTQKAILALYKSNREIPFSITVVDNGSDHDLVHRLKELHKAGIIDKLFLLPKNMGISCACNIGWEMTDAPFFAKIDNDTAPLRPDWLPALFRLWRHGTPLSNLGLAYDKKMLLQTPGSIKTEDGILGICSSNLCGTGLIIPKTVSDILGLFNEEYGLYGAEDGDYGTRMVAAGLKQYYYHGPDYFQWKMDDLIKESNYLEHGLNKSKEHKHLFIEQDGSSGLFRLNYLLYSYCIRSYKVKRRYEVVDVDDDCRVKVVERDDYPLTVEALAKCKELLFKNGHGNDFTIDFAEIVDELKSIMHRCGQSIDDFVIPALHET